MASTDTPVGSIASLLVAVQAQTDTTKNFKDEQINVFTTTEPTATVTDSDGNPVVIPSWSHLVEELSSTPAPTPTPTPTPAPASPYGVTNQSLDPNSFLATMVMVPYGYRDQMDNVALGSYADATVDSTGTVISTALNAWQLSNADPVGFVFRMDGRIPTFGKWWIVATIPIGSTSYDVAELNITTDPTNYLAAARTGPATAADVGVFEFSNDQQYDLQQVLGQTVLLANLFMSSTGLVLSGPVVEGVITGTVSSSYVAGTSFKLLLCLDVDDSTITVYDTTGFVGTIPVGLNQRGRSFLAGAYIDGALWGTDSNLTGSFNTSDATQSPYAVPDGYNGLLRSIRFDELGRTDLLDYVDFSNPFMSHVWLGPHGEMLGAVSAVTNQLWWQRGGFIAQDVAVLKNAISYMNLPNVLPNNSPATGEPWSMSNGIGHLPTTAGAGTQRYNTAVNSGFVSGLPVGVRASDGALEAYGQDVALALANQQLGGANKKHLQPPTNVFTIGDTAIFGTSIDAGSPPYGNYLNTVGSIIGYSLTSTEFAMLVGAVPMLVEFTGNAVLSGSLGVGSTNAFGLPGNVTQVATIYGLDGTDTLVEMNPFTDGGIVGSLMNIGSGNSNVATYGWLGAGPGSPYGVLGFVPGPSYETNQTQFSYLYPPSADTPAPSYIPFLADTNSALAVNQYFESSYIPNGEFVESIAVIAVGRTNIPDIVTIKRDLRAMVDALNYIGKQFVIVSPFNYTTEDNTTPNGQAVIALEQWIAFTYPRNSILSRPLLQALANSGDGTDYIASGIIPPSVWVASGGVPTTVLAEPGLEALQQAIYAFIINKGWGSFVALGPVQGV